MARTGVASRADFAPSMQSNHPGTMITISALIERKVQRNESVIARSTGQWTERRVCPCFRLPQLTPGQPLRARARLPVCAAVDPAEPVGRDQAARLCRSGEYPTCDWFRTAFPDWTPEDDMRPVTPASVAAPDETSRRLLSSAAWVIGIPTGITLLIILAIWFTENVWMPTQHILPLW